MKPKPDDPCHCGSGFAYRECHSDMENGVFPMTLPGHPSVKVETLGVRAEFVEQEETPIPAWYVGLARDFARQAAAPDGSDREVLLTILMTIAAAEAVVNRLLEPVVHPADWKKCERKPMLEKWVELSKELRFERPLKRGEAPLSGLAGVVEARNAIVHFKHGDNLHRRSVPLEASWARGVVTIGNPIGPPLEKRPMHDLRPALRKELAPGYIDAMRDVVNFALDQYPEDQFGVVRHLRFAVNAKL